MNDYFATNFFLSWPYPAYALISVIIFILVHLFAEKAASLGKVFHGRLLSAGGGMAIAYVFIDLLPKLCKNDAIVHNALSTVFPYFERHVYIMALLGFLLFFIVDRSSPLVQGKSSFWLSLGSYALFNFLIGYAVVDKNDPEVQPLALFTFAIALHYFTNDYSLTEAHGDDYRYEGKWILILSLFLGWLAGVWIILPEPAVALISAFIGGGVIMNVIRHELPEEKPNSLGSFLLFSAFYTTILLSIGS